jgi:hypothetical protein
MNGLVTSARVTFPACGAGLSVGVKDIGGGLQGAGDSGEDGREVGPGGCRRAHVAGGLLGQVPAVLQYLVEDLRRGEPVAQAFRDRRDDPVIDLF